MHGALRSADDECGKRATWPRGSTVVPDPHHSSGSRNNNDVGFRRNGVTQDGHTLATNPVPLTDDLFVGGLGSGNSGDMDIAQILVYDDILDLADIKTIESIITAIWGV